MRFITANTSPDHDTIADFRKRILPDLPSILLQVLLVARELGVLTVGQISLDGTKIKSKCLQASRLELRARRSDQGEATA
jgi:transposase